MDFECKICHIDYLTNEDAMKHYKLIHNSENKISIDCTVKNSKCRKCFQSYQGLKNHVKKCLIERGAVPLVDCESSSNNARQTSFVFNKNVEQSLTNHDENQLGLVYEEDDGMDCVENEPFMKKITEWIGLLVQLLLTQILFLDQMISILQLHMKYREIFC